MNVIFISIDDEEIVCLQKGCKWTCDQDLYEYGQNEQFKSNPNSYSNEYQYTSYEAPDYYYENY